jgi:hypothetical protein
MVLIMLAVAPELLPEKESSEICREQSSSCESTVTNSVKNCHSNLTAETAGCVFWNATI